MDIITADLETFWAQGHSLSNMTNIDYCTHPDTEIISCSIKINNEPTQVYFGEESVRFAFESMRKTISNGMLIAHNNAGFDALIFAWRFGLTPKRWGCTLAMARPIHSLTVGNSLAKLVQHYGLGVKDNTALLNTKGKHLADFTPEEIAAMRTYNKADTDQCKALFDILVQSTSPRELWLIDSTIRMLIEPKFELDLPMLQTALRRERVKKRKSLLELAQTLGLAPGATDEATAIAVRGELMSAPKFSAILTGQGVEVPMKPSPSSPDSGKMVPALAKTDEDFLALQEHDNPLVAAAATARLEAKSTLLETRLESFMAAGERCGGKLPIPITYYGAHTGRDSGCLVADTTVLVYDHILCKRVSKNIVDVLLTDTVWDGIEFVKHGGVVFSGYAEVINWDNVTGTKDHVVFTDAGEISLFEARARAMPITPAGSPE